MLKKMTIDGGSSGQWFEHFHNAAVILSLTHKAFLTILFTTKSKFLSPYLLSQPEFSHPRYPGLTDYFDSIVNDYPHSLFQTDKGSSQTKIDFDFNQTQIPRKENHATRLAQVVLQAVTDYRMRHEALQQFMLVNDSVTVAMEVPIYLKPQDLIHFNQKLKFIESHFSVILRLDC